MCFIARLLSAMIFFAVSLIFSLRSGVGLNSVARFAVEAAGPADSHRPLLATHKLEQILSLRIARTLINDYTLRNDNQFYQVLEQQVGTFVGGEAACEAKRQ